MYSRGKIRLDPRTKLFLFATWFSAVFLCRDIYTLAILFALSMLTLLLSGSFTSVFSRLKHFIPIILLAWPLWTFLNRWSIFHASIGFDPFLGLFMTIRLLLIIVLSMAFLTLVKPTEIVKALSSLKIPSVVTAVFALALRTLYIVEENYKSIKEAHISRGLELDKGSLIKRIRAHIPLLIPLIIRSIDSAEKMVLALELRPVLLNGRKSNPLKAGDMLIIIGCLLLIILLIYYNFFLVGSI
ncbi:MAG: energy-coupling factor transporter transmembrane protein EcfT [Thermoproteota archaeon]|nr:MAG: energy-coupling factor transporter transmembrane protein EcfT [Candidatus Korarchaeota archaeon]